MKIFAFAVFFLVIIFSSNSCKNSEVKKDGKLETLRKYSTIISDTTFSNLDSFSKLFPEHVFDDKILVGCGQSSHGSHEDFEIQKMVFENLVEKHGCRIFIMEASYSTLLAVNKYVSDGVGIKSEVMKSLGFLWVWDTQEVWELIEWTKNFNAGKSENEKILFLGNDMQHLSGTSNAILNFFKQYNPKALTETKKILQPFLEDSFYVLKKHTDDEKNNFKMGVKRINELINQTNFPYESPPTPDFILQKRNGMMLEQTLALFNSVYNASTNRDSMMAANTKWIIENKFRTGPVFLWAHNFHIQNAEMRSYKNMGNWLKSFYGEKYYTIGVDFIFGSITARYYSDKKDTAKKLSPPESFLTKLSDLSLDHEIGKLLPGLLFLNLESAKKDTLFTNDWRVHNKIHSIGAVYNVSFPYADYEDMNVKSQFDALIFCNYSTPTILLHSRSYVSKIGV